MQVDWRNYRQHYGTYMKGLSRKNDDMLLTYRQFVRRCWDILDKELRAVQLVVFEHTSHHKLGLEEDFVFESFKFPDE